MTLVPRSLKGILQTPMLRCRSGPIGKCFQRNLYTQRPMDIHLVTDVDQLDEFVEGWEALVDITSLPRVVVPLWPHGPGK